jgi:predicted RNA-binding Zn-ribbon protein involved in translation (DUF1610 family)
MVLGVLVVVALFAFAIWSSTSSPAARARRAAKAERDAQLVCPHCQKAGYVRSLGVVRKRGVSGGKATGALLTGGVSLLLVGLSRKERATRMHCANCGTTWDV